MIPFSFNILESVALATTPPAQPFATGSGSPDSPNQPPFRELSRTFWRGISSTQNLGPAMEAVLLEFSRHVGARRTSVWLHERRARELSLLASSEPAYSAVTARIASSDAEMPAARGLRLEHPQVLLDGAEPVVISPLRGWRRALGTLVVEWGSPRDFDAQQHLDLAGDLGRQLSLGIENVQLFEEMLRQRRLLEDTFNSLVDLVVVTDHARRVVQMNDAFATRLGRSRAELAEQHLSDLVGAELSEWAAAVEGGAADGTHEGARTRTFSHPGLGGIFDVTTTPLINEDGEPVGIVLVARDVSHQTALEAEQDALRARLAQSEKLASLGQFVAGIAHEINNPLQGVLGHLELLLWSHSTDGRLPAETPRKIKKELRLIYHEADRAAKIVRNLLTFTGSQRMTRRRLRVDRVLTRVLATRRASLSRAAIEIVREPGENLPWVLGDQLLLQQAFLNVLVNAEHAIAATGEAGVIRITTSAPDPTMVRITMADNGPGISPSVLPRIFDPFFTTKEVGEGTGLGLTITYGVIQEHGGSIQAANAPEGGAVFTIDLPAVGRPPSKT
jgi:PAS domain S-box-containing protein